MAFVNLHTHSHYSLLDGYGSPKDIVLRAKELGSKAIALTDHGVMYGLIEFYNAAKNEGIKPILGCEIYVARRTRFDKEAKIDISPYHLTLLAENNEGYQNLMKLVTKGNLEGFYYKPRVDYGLLKTYSKGLIALSGCLIGHVPRSILSGNEEEIKKVIEANIEIFGKKNYFFELQDHPLIEDQIIVNKKLKELSKKYGIGLVATNDSHYPRPEDSEVHDILLCIQTQTTVSDENRMRYTGDFSIRDEDDMKIAFEDFPNAIKNTAEISDRCETSFEFGKNLIPSFVTPQNEKPEIYLRQLCEIGLKNRFDEKEVPKEYIDRLEYELKTVHKMGFDTYFLIVHDFVKYAKDKEIYVGPGRGSAAGSIIAWSLRITDLNPITNGLFFERFLNPERVSMPDIDIDFADDRRDEVLEYVINKYGRDNVAQIVTFGTMAPRAAVRDTGRALGYPYAEVDKLAKTIPAPILGKTPPLKKSIKEDPDLKKVYDEEPRSKALLDYAMRLEGTVRHAGTHACAVVISEKPLVEYTPLQYGARGGHEIVTQYSMKPIEYLGLLKMDFLGLKNLTVIGATCKLIEKMDGKKIDVNAFPLDDKKTFDLLKKADTTGVFQLESAGMRRYLKELEPNKFEDIVAMGALYRPGPMEWIPTYIKGKHKPESVKYLHESFKPILESTYGVAVYQEQILQLARDFAGYTLGEADILRMAVGKKIGSMLVEQRKKFIKGAIDKGHEKKFAELVFEDVIMPFAGYGFNRAHAVCYGMIAFQTAYLKAHYPVKFMTALLCSDAENTDRVVLEIKECKEMSLDVLPPSINESFERFTMVNEKTIRFGLLAVKGVGEGPVKEIIEIRQKGGSFQSLEDFTNRVPPKILNKKLIQALAYSGALDEFGDRNQLAENYEEISKYAKLSQDAATNGQISIFGLMDGGDSMNAMLNLKPQKPATQLQKLKWEKALLGMYVSNHPLHGLTRYIRKKANLIGDLTKKQLNKSVKLVGIISNFRKILTKNGGYMSTFVIEDTTGRVNVVMFPRVLAQYGDVLVEDQIVTLGGKLTYRRGQYGVICDCAKSLSLDAMIANAKETKSYNLEEKADIAPRLLDDILADEEPEIDISTSESIKQETACDTGVKVESDVYSIEIPGESSDKVMQSLKEILSRNKGETPVELYFRKAKKKIKLPFAVNVTESLKKSIEKLLV